MPTPFLRLGRRAVAAVAASLSLAAAGCDLSTENTQTPQFAVQLFTASAPLTAGTAPIVEVIPVQRAMQANSTFLVPCLAAGGRTDHQVTTTEITLRITFVAPSGTCNDPVGYDYRAYLTNVPSGTYQLRLIHEGDLQVPSGTAVYQGNVVIP